MLLNVSEVTSVLASQTGKLVLVLFLNKQEKGKKYLRWSSGSVKLSLFGESGRQVCWLYVCGACWETVLSGSHISA